jgi:hypothetical protein
MCIDITDGKTRTAAIWGLALIIAFSCTGSLAQLIGKDNSLLSAKLSEPAKTVTYISAAPSTFTYPFFHNGYLIQVRHIVPRAGNPNIYLYNLGGSLEQKISIWPQEAAKFRLTAADVGPTHQLELSGEEVKHDGSRMSFIAVANIDGSNARYFSTGDFLASQLAIADDGSIWTVVAERTKTLNLEKTWKNYDMLWHLRPDGTPLGHYLPRWGSATSYVVLHLASDSKQVTSQAAESVVSGTDVQVPASTGHARLLAYDVSGKLLATYGPPFWGPSENYKRGKHRAWLRTIGNGIVLYDGRSGSLYVYSASTDTLSSRLVKRGGLTDTSEIYGIAGSLDGSIYANFRHLDLNRKTHSRKHTGDDGLYELVTPTAGLAYWSPVAIDPSIRKSLSPKFSVLGVDDRYLVYESKRAQVNWSMVQHVRDGKHQ